MVSAPEPIEGPKMRQTQHAEATTHSPSDIRHNMIVLIMLDSIFVMGASDLQIAFGPLWKYLNASNTLIGLMGPFGSIGILALVGVFLAPLITLRFRFKKWLLLAVHIPYIGMWGLIGLALIFSSHLNLSIETMLIAVVSLNAANIFFGGFVTLPHQEYTAACIPMSHRGRFTGYSQCIGSVLGIVSSAIGGIILIHVARPMSYGYLFVLTWVICQAGYLLALLGRELPTPVERAPRAWSKDMLRSFWQDKPFLVVLFMSILYQSLFFPTFNMYVAQYGLRELQMADATAATMAIIMQASRILLAGFAGHFIDKISPKRAVPLLAIFGGFSLVPLIFLHNPLGVYLGTACAAVYLVGHYAAFFALLYGIPSPENRAGHYTMQLVISYPLVAIGTALTGWMYDKLSYRPGFAVLAILSLALALVAYRVMANFSTNPQDYS